MQKSDKKGYTQISFFAIAVRSAAQQVAKARRTHAPEPCGAFRVGPRSWLETSDVIKSESRRRESSQNEKIARVEFASKLR